MVMAEVVAHSAQISFAFLLSIFIFIVHTEWKKGKKNNNNKPYCWTFFSMPHKKLPQPYIMVMFMRILNSILLFLLFATLFIPALEFMANFNANVGD
jgi:hypothetical protein